MSKKTRIGLLYPNKDATSPANWSGTPRGLHDGLQSLGVDVVKISCALSPWVRIPVTLFAKMDGAAHMVAQRKPAYARARSRAIASAIRSAGPLDGIVAMGTDVFDLPLALAGCDAPVVTYDDGTFALFLRYPDSDLVRANLPIDEVRSWVRLQESACRRADIACVSTGWAKRSVVDDFGVAEDRVEVVGMGHRPRTVDINSRGFDRPRFLFVGVDWRRKNGEAVLNAFAKVREQFPDATLDMVGEHPPLDRPGVTGHGFLPRQDAAAQATLDRLFAQATAFVLPSLFDPSPIAYLEAASAGLPVVATTCGGAGELLGDAAISVDPYEHDALARALLRLANPDVARAMGASALARSRDATWQAVSRRILGCLLRCGRRTTMTDRTFARVFG